MVTGIGAISATSPTANNVMNAVGGTSGPQAPLKEPPKSDRRSNKPIMEKRRRARINNCLNELKTLILDATKKDPARHSKLEKADILEKTVKHLQDLQRQQAAMTQAADPKIVNKFKAGFAECANEVSRFPGIEPTVKRRLLQHLSNCINGVKSELSQNRNITNSNQSMPSQVHLLPSPPSSPEQDHHNNNNNTNNAQHQHQHHHHHQQHSHHQNMIHHSTQLQATVNGYFLPNGVQVIPTRLPNGNIALVLPQSVPQSSQLPTLVPIPSRTSSTSSAASIPTSSYERISRDNNNISPTMYAPPSPANSYEAMDCQPSVIQHASSSSHHHLQHHQSHNLNNNNNNNNHHHNSSQQLHQPSSYNSDAAPLSLVMKKIKDEDQPWRPW